MSEGARPERASVVVLAGLALAALVASAGAAAIAGAPATRVVLLLGCAFAPYVALARAPLAPGWTRGLCVAAGGVLVLAPPVLSDDVWRYLWDARVLTHGLDPYARAPDDPALAELRNEVWARVSFREIPTIYPPVAQLLFALARSLADAPAAVKLVALGLHLLTGEVLLRAASDPRAHALFVLSPLALGESALSGHVDVAAGLFVLVAVVALGHGHPRRAAVLAALATGTKLVGLLLLPALRRDRSALAVAALLSAALVLPLASAGRASSGAAPGAAHYARRWRGNGAAFALVEESVLLGVSGLATLRGDPPRLVRVPGAAWLSEHAAGSALDPHAESFAGEPPADRRFVPRRVAAGMLARALVLASVLAFAVWRQRGVAVAREARDVLLLALLLSPQVHPWYLLWALPLELLSGGVAVRVWSFAVLAAYAPLDRWATEGVWEEVPGAALAQLGAVLGALVWERRAARGGVWTSPEARGTPLPLSKR